MVTSVLFGTNTKNIKANEMGKSEGGKLDLNEKLQHKRQYFYRLCRYKEAWEEREIWINLNLKDLLKGGLWE